MLIYGLMRGVKGLLLNWRSAAQHFIILTTSLSLLGVLALTVFNVQTLANHFLRSAPVSLFLEPSAEEEERKALLGTLKKHPLVRDVRLVTPEKGFAELSTHLGVENILLREVDHSTLPYTIDFRVPSQKKSAMHAFIQSLRNHEVVADVVLADNLLARMRGVFAALRGTGLFMLGLGLLAFVLVMMHATQLSLISRKKELQVFSLMGVPQTAVHFSFMVESVFLTLSSGVSALVLLWIFLNAVRLALQVNAIAESITAFLVYFPPLIWGGALVTISLLGVFGSAIVTHQILRETY